MTTYELMKDQPPEGAVFKDVWFPGDCRFTLTDGTRWSTSAPPSIADQVTGCEKRETGYLLDPPECTPETKWFFVLGDKK